MFLDSKDYDTTALFIAALKAYNANEGDAYVTKVKYDLERDCDARDYFVNLLQLQKSDEYLMTYPFPGFEDYVGPVPTFGITYINGFATSYAAGAPTTYQPGVTTIAITTQPLNSNIVLNEVDIILEFGGVEFTATTNSSGVASFSFTAPSTLTGDVVVTTRLADAPSNAVALGYHAVPVDTSTYSLVDGATYGLSLIANGAIAVGDVNEDGVVAQNDLVAALGVFGTEFRTKFTKHATVTLGSLFYYQGVEGTLAYTITPVGTDYTYGSGITGQAKTLNDLKWQIATVDSDGQPTTAGNIQTITGSGLSLNPDGSYGGVININSAFSTGILAVFTMLRANNTATLQSSNHTGIAAAITSGTRFEPGEVVTVSFTDDANDLADLEGSLIKVGGYDSNALTGGSVVTQTITVGAGNTGTANLTIPSNYDKDIFLQSGFSFYKVNNLISQENLSDSPLNVSTFITTSVDVTYYTSPNQTITITVAMVGSNNRSDYALSISVVETGNLVHTLASGDTSNSTFTFTPTTGNLNGAGSQVIKYSLANA